MNPPTPTPISRIAVKSGPEIKLLNIADIDWIEADDNYVNIWHNGQRHHKRGPLKSLATRLAKQGFIRIHRSILVNIHSITSLKQLPHGCASITLRSGQDLHVSRSAASRTRRMLLYTG